MKRQHRLQISFFPIPMLALLLGALSGCASTGGARSDWQAKIPPDCRVAEVQFTRHGGPRLLVLHVNGLEQATAAKLAGGVREALMGSIAEKRQSRIWRKVLPSKMQAVELHCAARSHDEAFWVGRLSGADAVLWGTLRERTSSEKLASTAPEASAEAATSPRPDAIAFHLTPTQPANRKSPFGRLVNFPPIPWLTRLVAHTEDGPAPVMKTGGTVGPSPFNPGSQPVPCYVGNEVHKAIGKFYQVAHPLDRVFLNHNSISRILDEANLPRPRGTPQAVLAARPDIFNLTLRYLYEIKPVSRLSEAVAEALLYQRYLKQVGLNTSLGPPGDPGTQGILPAPKGYVVFYVQGPGAIVYYCAEGSYQYAPETATAPDAAAETAPATKNQQVTRSLTKVSPALRPAEPWWKQSDLVASLEAATGLTGTALIAYLVVSEGLRFVLPVRNLVLTLP